MKTALILVGLLLAITALILAYAALVEEEEENRHD